MTKQDFTAKNFCTWPGMVLAAMALCDGLKYDTWAQVKKNADAYMTGEFVHMVEGKIEKKFHLATLSSDEVVVLAFLHKRLTPKRKTKD